MLAATLPKKMGASSSPTKRLSFPVSQLMLLDRFVPQVNCGGEKKLAVQLSKADVISKNFLELSATSDDRFDFFRRAEKLVETMSVSPRDIREFAGMLLQFLGIHEFHFKAGYYISLMLNKCASEGKVTGFRLDLRKTPGVHFIGYRNKINLVVLGNLGGVLGSEAEGSIELFGNTQNDLGYMQKGAAIIIHGDVGANVGEKLFGGVIRVDGNIGSLSGMRLGGDIFQRGRQLVKRGEEIGQVENK